MEECRGLIILCPVACFQYSIRVFLHVSTFYIPSLRYYKFPFNFSIEGKIGGKKGEKKFLFAKIDRSEINFKKIERSAYFDLSSLLFVEKLGIFFFPKKGTSVTIREKSNIELESFHIGFSGGRKLARLGRRTTIGSTRFIFLRVAASARGNFLLEKRNGNFSSFEEGRTSLSPFATYCSIFSCFPSNSPRRSGHLME